MLVKNTIIALMAVAPALSIPVPAAVKSAVATTKATVATKATVGTKAASTNPTSQRISKASVKKAEGNVDRDVAAEKSLRAQLKAADARLAKDTTSARKLEKAELAQEKSDKAARKAALKAAGSSSSHRTTNGRTDQGLNRNKNNLRVDTNRLQNHHSTALRPGWLTAALPGSSRRTAHAVTTLGSSPRMIKIKGPGATTPGSAPRMIKIKGPDAPGTGFPNALGTGRSQFGFPGPQTGFQSPPVSGRFRGMTEDITYTPTTGGGYKESISWGQQPGSAKRLARRALTTPTTPTTPATPTTPVSPPLSPLAAFLQKHRAQKSSRIHKHTVSESMQLSQMLIEAEKVVNGLEEQMNKPHTVFHNLKRKSALKRLSLTAPKTPTTPATPTTPSSTVVRNL